MSEEKTTTEKTTPEVTTPEVTEKKTFVKKRFSPQGRKPRANFERPKPEFDQRIISLRRVVRVMAGGRRFSFSVAMVIGDKKGRIGVGTGKSTDTSLAIEKAVRSAKKNLIKVKLTEGSSIPYGVDYKYSSSTITFMPNNGRGIVAGSALRDLFELGGITNITAKIHSRSKNKLNIARATVAALMTIEGSVKAPVKHIPQAPRKPFRRNAPRRENKPS
ncbi:MAG: small subunit ribosomal protein S5 [Flavobacteriaceae bacterium]|jgi:small subunit ribosomal protein S5